MKQSVRLGVVCLARKTFDYHAAEAIYEKILEDLYVITQVEIEVISGLTIEIEDARNAAKYLQGKHIDGLVVISGTFHLGHLVLEMEKVLHVPILLWALNELPYNGGKIRLNSVCGINLDASNLYKSGVKNYTACIGDEIDMNWVDALRIDAALKETHLGILGFRAKGFFNLGVYDLDVYHHMGLLIDHYELGDVWNYPADEQEVLRRIEEIHSIFETSDVTEHQVRRMAELVVKFDGFTDTHNITALAVRCWPEFADGFGIAPCAAMSLLQSEGKLLVCEGDIEGAVSMVAHRAVGGEYPYLFDFSQMDFEEDYALLWHCGVAPCNLSDNRCVRSLSSYHAGGKGVTADFVLKDGEVSVLRFDSAGGTYRVLLAQGSVIPMEKELRGTYMKVRFTLPVRDLLQKIITNGIAHHASVVYGDFLEPFRVYARLKGWEVIE